MLSHSCFPEWSGRGEALVMDAQDVLWFPWYVYSITAFWVLAMGAGKMKSVAYVL